MDEKSSEKVDLPQARANGIGGCPSKQDFFWQSICLPDCFIGCKPLATISVGICKYSMASHHVRCLAEALWQELCGKYCLEKSFGKSCLITAAGTSYLLELIGRS